MVLIGRKEGTRQETTQWATDSTLQAETTASQAERVFYEVQGGAAEDTHMGGQPEMELKQ